MNDLSDPKYGTHLVPMAACLTLTKGRVLEVGCGNWSSPFLQRYCLAAGRELATAESDPTWAENVGAVPLDYDSALPRLAREPWSIVLIDHWPEERRLSDAELFADSEVVLIHDWVKMTRYKLQTSLWAFRHICYDTMVLSHRPEIINVAKALG